MPNLAAIGVNLERDGDRLVVDSSNVGHGPAPYELVSQLRASFFVIGPLLSRLGMTKVPLPGGCAIGTRPVDLHVRGLQAMGADVHIEHGVVNASIKGHSRRLTGAKIYLDYPSVGATETILMAATLAEGETVIDNAAREPEIVDLANFCRSMGAQIRGDGSSRIIINGVEKLHSTDFPLFLIALRPLRSSVPGPSPIPKLVFSLWCQITSPPPLPSCGKLAPKWRSMPRIGCV